MTFTSSVRLRGRLRFTQSWRRHCVRRLASTSTSNINDRCLDVHSPAGGSRRSCVERRLDFATEPAGHQGSWSAHRPPSFIKAHKIKEQASLFERIPLFEDVQIGWLLLVFCTTTRVSEAVHEHHRVNVVYSVPSFHRDAHPPLATTAQRVAQEGFWAGRVSQQRVPSLRYFGRGGAKVSTNVMVRGP